MKIKRNTDLLITIWPFLPIGAAAALIVSPVTTVDSRVLIADYLNDFVFPHFPPLYPLFARAFATAGTWREPIYSAVSIKLILVVQHLLTIMAAGYLANRLPLTLWGKRLVIGVLYLNPVTLHVTHSLLTEALVTPAMLAAIAEAIPLLVGGQWVVWRAVLFSFWVTLAALSRHTAILLGLLLPAGYAIETLLAAFRRDRLQTLTAIRRGTVTAALAAMVFVAYQGLSILAMHSFGVEPRSTFGRSFVYRITPASTHYIFIPDEEFRRTLARLQSNAPDADIAAALRIIENTGFGWVDAFNEVTKYLEGKQCAGCAPHTNIWAETDRLLNRTAAYVMLTPDSTMWKDAALRTLFTLAPGLVPGSLLLSYTSSDNRGLDLAAVPPTEALKTTDIQTSFPLRIGRDFGHFLKLVADARKFLVPAMMTLSLLLLLYANSPAVLVMAIYLIAVMIAAAASLVTVYIPRYGVMIDQLSIIGPVLAGAFATQRLRQRRQRGA
jgi:hypothetical protein